MAGQRVLRRTSVVFAMLLISTPGATAQTDGLSRTDYLRAIGLLENAVGIEQWLRAPLEGMAGPEQIEQANEMAAFFAFILAVHGLTADILTELGAEGVDVIHAITSDSRPLVEQSLMADLVAVGQVLREDAEPESADGFPISTHVRILRRLKGPAGADTIVIRQRDPQDGSSRDVRPEKGRRYLFLLSNGMYRYRAARRMAEASNAAWTHENWGPEHFTIYRIYEFRNGRVDFAGYDRRGTERAFAEIEWLDRRLKDLMH